MSEPVTILLRRVERGESDAAAELLPRGRFAAGTG